MKFKIVQCLSRDVVDAEKDIWVYASKEWIGLSKNSNTSKSVHPHRVPWFLSLHMHLTIEGALEDLLNMTIFPQFTFKKLLFVYDVLHGIICAYNMREILEWWRARGLDGLMNLKEVLILRRQFCEKDDELKNGNQKNKKLSDEVLRLNGAVCTAMAQLSKKDMAKFEKIHEKEAEAFIKKMGSKLWTS